MKPIKQTIFGEPDGNCFAACIASLLEIAIEEVSINPTADDWLPSTQAFLKGKGLFYLEVRIDIAVNYPMYELNDVWVIYYGKSPRGDFGHAVIGKLNCENEQVRLEMMHDPHPDGTFLDGKPKGIGFLVSLDPARICIKSS